MADFHFVEDYAELVRSLKEQYSVDEAMRRAIGARSEESFIKSGQVASDVVLYAGAKDGDAVLDFGCGVGRVSVPLSEKIRISQFLGTDIVQDLVDYAAEKSPPHFDYKMHRELSIPTSDDVFDIAYAFSVFTHLLQTECYKYLVDIQRVLKPGGTLVASFLEFAKNSHWEVFQASFNAPHLNIFIERNQWEVWAGHAGLEVVEFIDGHARISEAGFLGQSIAIFRKPMISA